MEEEKDTYLANKRCRQHDLCCRSFTQVPMTRVDYLHINGNHLQAAKNRDVLDMSVMNGWLIHNNHSGQLTPAHLGTVCRHLGVMFG